MKNSRRLAETTFEESKKIEGIINTYDPEYIKVNNVDYGRRMNLESILLNDSFYSDLQSVYKLSFDSFVRYQNVLKEAFRFYQEDIYIETANLINKQTDILEDDHLKREVGKLGFLRTSEFSVQKIAKIPGLDYTLNGWMRMPVVETKSYPFKIYNNLHGEKFDYAGFSLVRGKHNRSDFHLYMDFVGAPRVINTLLIPISLPLPSTIEYVEFLDSSGQSLKVFSDLEPYRSTYQVELMFAPLAVQRIKIKFSDVLGKRMEEWEDQASFNELYKSVLKKDIVNDTKTLFNVKNDSEGFWYYVACFPFPLLRKYRTLFEGEVRIPSKKEIKAISCLYDKRDFGIEGEITSEKAVTNSRIQVGVSNESLLEYFPLPRSNHYNGSEEQFMRKEGQSINIGVPIQNHRAYFRASENYEIPVDVQDNYIKLKRKVGDKIIWKYDFLSDFKYPVIIDVLGNLVFKNPRESQELRLKFVLESFDHGCYFSPLIKNIVIGQL